MRTLTIDDNWEDWKFGDTDAVMTFTALDDYQTPDFTGKTLTFKIADTTASTPESPHDYVASAAGNVEDNKVVLKTEDVKALTPGTYSVELWALDNSTQKNAVYPSKGFAFFTIEENTMRVSDITNVPSKTLEAIWAEMLQRVDALKQGDQGEPGQTPKLIIGTVTKVGSDQQPSVSLISTADDPNTYTINFQIPQGEQGKQGDPGVPGTPGIQGLPGKDGLTPSIDSKTKHWIIGNTDTEIVAEGQPGQTPVKGTDYWTDADKQEIQAEGQKYIESTLAKISLEPEAFENEAALKAKYPNGKSGIMVTVDTGHKWLWANSTWTDAGVYQSVGIADGSVGWKERTPVGSQAQVQYVGIGRINFDFENKLIVIPKNTYIVVGKNNISIGYDITTAIPTATDSSPDPIFFILTVSPQETKFNCYTSANFNEMSESEVVIAVCNNAQKTVEMNGDYLINGRARIVYAQPVITYQSDVTYKINSDGTMLVTFAKNDQFQVIISYPSAQKRVPVEASYTLKNSEALVYNSRDNSLVALNFDSLLPDSLIIISNYYGKIQNNINAVQGDGNYEYYSDGTENVIYYAGTVTAKKNGTAIDVNFDRADTRLFYKDSAGNHQMNVAESMYTVPHNFSLVLNRETKSLEVINTDNVIRGVHSILIACHLGFAKKVGMYFNSLRTGISELLTSGKIPINRYKTYVGQDATKVGDEYWLFDESTPDHMSTAYIHRINPTDFSEIGLITHNLGHANGVDYRDNALLVYNGSALPPEINLYTNPDNTKTDLKIQDAANTQIIFKESSKLLPGDGSACFGPDKKNVYYAYSAGGTQVVILKILLGLGDNDLSDKTTDKSDNQHWGSFVSGKSSDEYNGTAQIIASYTGNISGDSQPQGMAFNGDLYLGTSHSEQKAYQLQLLDDGSFKVVDFYKSEMTDYKNNVIGLEPEITFIDPVKRSLFIGARGGDKSSLSNVAEFNL